jgi:hypothetical protein
MDTADLGPFAFIRAEKLRTRRQLRAAKEHNDRTAESGLEHTDPSRPPELIAGHPDAVEAWEAAMVSKGLDPTTPRKGAVLAVEWVATASPEWWATASAEQRAAWTADTLAFVCDEMAGAVRPGEDPAARAERGRGLILAAHYHDDETTPHLHVLAVPLVEKERTARGRPRKRDAGKPRPTTGATWDLAAKDILGGPRDRMSELQTDYAAAVAHHGLKRGIPKKETGAFNKRPSHYRAEQAHLTEALRTDRRTAALAKTDAALIRAASVDGMNDTIAKTHRKATTIIEGAKVQAGAIIDAATHQGLRIVSWAKGLGEAVKADAQRLGRAISFPAYEDDPKAAEARQAIKDAEARREAEKQAQRQRNQPPAINSPERSRGRERGR